MFQHILVPIDGSTKSVAAARAAIEVSIKFDSRITLLHVARKFEVPEPLKEYLKREHLIGDPIVAIDEATEKVVKDLVDEGKEAGVQRISAEIKEGKPSRTIVDVARAKKVDCIMLGSRGLTEIDGALLGSVSHKVASLAHCTVMVVR